MNKNIMILIGSLLGALIIGFGIYQSGATESEPKLTRDDIEELVTNQYPGTITEIDLKKKQNNYIYEIEIERNGEEYELLLDGNNGEVLQLEGRSMNEEDLVVDDQEGNVEENDKNLGESKGDQADNSTKFLDPKKAIDIALNEFPGIVKELELQAKDGGLFYEIEVIADHVEMEFDIDAHTGEIIKRDRESTEKNYDRSAIITAKEALDIAFSKFSGRLKELELEEDDGLLIYEIEIKSGKEEAEIEINAYTGEVIVIEIDRD